MRMDNARGIQQRGAGAASLVICLPDHDLIRNQSNSSLLLGQPNSDSKTRTQKAGTASGCMIEHARRGFSGGSVDLEQNVHGVLLVVTKRSPSHSITVASVPALVAATVNRLLPCFGSAAALRLAAASAPSSWQLPMPAPLPRPCLAVIPAPVTPHRLFRDATWCSPRASLKQHCWRCPRSRPGAVLRCS